MGEKIEDLVDGVIRIMNTRPGAAMRIVVVDTDAGDGKLAAAAPRPDAPPGTPPAVDPATGHDVLPPPPDTVERVFRVKWNVQGHGVIATVALENIVQAEAPEVYARIKQLLHDDPVGRKTIVDSAQWPDRIKPPTQYPFTKWAALANKTRSEHYINYRLDDPDQPDASPKSLGDKPTLLDGLPLYIKKLASETDPTERGHALAFVSHWMGDIHQPLHCAVLCGKYFPPDEFPEGDQGGNLVWWGEGQNLHALWDGLVCKTKDDFTDAVAGLTNGLTRAAYADRLKLAAPADWALETYRAAAVGYARFLADAEYLNRSTRTNKKDGSETDGQLFEAPSKAYREWARGVAFDQGRIAAFRLADVYIQAFS